MQIVIDTNSLIYAAKEKLDLISELKNMGFTKIVIPKEVLSELEHIQTDKKQKGTDKIAAKLALQIIKFSKVIKKIKPDLIVVHGDRVEAMGCALVGSLNHILTGHVEGGEVSGTIDDTIRHALTKLSHVHFVGTHKAKARILRMGELKKGQKITVKVLRHGKTLTLDVQL